LDFEVGGFSGTRKKPKKTNFRKIRQSVAETFLSAKFVSLSSLFKFIFTALRCMHCMQRGLATRKLSVCPSVCLSRVICDKTKKSCAHILIPHERSFYPSFMTRRMDSGGQPLLPEILGQTGPVEAKTPIFSRYSLVAPQP